jgi:23S rRNA pseudouridine2457 synthase
MQLLYEYIALYKPFGVVAQFSGAGRTLKDLVPIPGVYPAGRLDKDSEGLLLLTNDGGFQHRISHPAQVEGAPTDDQLEPLRRGIRVQDYVCRPAQVRILKAPPRLPPRDPPIRYRASIPVSWVEIRLREGRNRQVRRMLAAAGFPVLRLVREAVGDLHLGGLQPGEWRRFRPEETGIERGR